MFDLLKIIQFKHQRMQKICKIPHWFGLLQEDYYWGFLISMIYLFPWPIIKASLGDDTGVVMNCDSG